MQQNIEYAMGAAIILAAAAIIVRLLMDSAGRGKEAPEERSGARDRGASGS